MKKLFKWWDEPMARGDYATIIMVNCGVIYCLGSYGCLIREGFNKLKNKFIHR